MGEYSANLSSFLYFPYETENIEKKTKHEIPKDRKERKKERWGERNEERKLESLKKERKMDR